jgi:hypothetical protein
VEFYVKNKKCKSKVKKVEQGGSGCVKKCRRRRAQKSANLLKMQNFLQIFCRILQFAEKKF